MLLRVKDGFYKGEVREFPFVVARALLAAGRAENPFADPAPEATPVKAELSPAVPRQSRRRSAR